MLDIRGVQGQLNRDLLEEPQLDARARLTRFFIVKDPLDFLVAVLIVRPQEQSPLEAVFGDQNLNGVLSDHEDVTRLFCGSLPTNEEFSMSIRNSYSHPSLPEEQMGMQIDRCSARILSHSMSVVDVVCYQRGRLQ